MEKLWEKRTKVTNKQNKLKPDRLHVTTVYRENLNPKEFLISRVKEVILD